MATKEDADRPPHRGRGVAGPLGSHLEQVAAAEVEVEQIREAAEIVGRDLPRVDWVRVTLRRCRVRLLGVAELVLDRSRLIDVTIIEPDITNLSGPESTWRGVEVHGGRIGAWDQGGGVLDAVDVVGAQLGYVNLRDATLTDVALRDCRIEALDLAGATVRRLTLHGCVIAELVVTRANLDAADLRGARLGRIEGVGNLAGATISADQLLDVAAALARAAGITVGPWPV